MTQPTIYDVARKAGVGISTVSRVMNNSPRVKASTRARVMEAIKALNYRPDTSARRLPRKTRLQHIGVLLQPFYAYHSFSERLRGVQTALHEFEDTYELLLYNINSLERLTEQIEAIATAQAVEALIIVDFDLTADDVRLLQDASLPFIGINHQVNADWQRLGHDNVAGGELATQHLIDLEHRRIAYIGDEFYQGPFGFATSQQRYKGYERALQRAGIPANEQYVRVGEHDSDLAYEMMKDLLLLDEPPTAVFAMSDIQAMGCLSAIRESGYRVPEDVSVIGYDDLDVSQYVELTTVRQHLSLSGYLSLTYLIHQLQRDDPPPLELPPLEIVKRRTTSSPA